MVLVNMLRLFQSKEKQEKQFLQHYKKFQMRKTVNQVKGKLLVAELFITTLKNKMHKYFEPDTYLDFFVNFDTKKPTLVTGDIEQ